MLNDKARQLINHCEFEWFSKGALPTPEQLQTTFKLSPKKLNELLTDPDVLKSFEGRGIPTIEGRTLTAEQVTAINVVLNTTDKRSQTKKLADMGIPAAKWNGWKQSAAFKEYYKKRVESIFGDALPDVHMALMDRAVNGDLGALKFYYEITGHYTGNGQAVDLKMILERVFEIISLHVKDPNVLSSLAGDLLKLAGVDAQANINSEPPVAGVVVGEDNKPEIERGFF